MVTFSRSQTISTPTHDLANVYIGARCHCGNARFTIPFLQARLPMKCDFCHFSKCRHVTGGMVVSRVLIDGSPRRFPSRSSSSHLSEASGNRSKGFDELEIDLTGLTRYDDVGHGCRGYFCARCGANVLYEALPQDRSAGNVPADCSPANGAYWLETWSAWKGL